MIAASLVMVASVGMPVVAAGNALAASVLHPSASHTAAASSNAGVATVGTSSGLPVSPHPGTLNVHKDASGGITGQGLDPSVCYYTVCYEPILNVYDTLVAYNGSSAATFVPQAATCVPGTAQCTADYGGVGGIPGFTGIFNASGGVFTGSNGNPIYWTFVIDPVQKFYDPANTTSWPVYPIDAAYSLIRTVGYSDLPFVARTPGWIDAQSLLPIGSPSFDTYLGAPEHFPFNNTPFNTWSSLLINNSSFCPANAIGPKGHGCITFVANGEGQPWSEFLQFIGDNLGSSIESCGWTQAHGGGVPGIVGTVNVHGDGPCALPGGGNSTDDASFQAYLASVAPGSGTQSAGTGDYSWDHFENQTANFPQDNPALYGTEIGSGPYWSSVSLATGYGLRANPAYLQPSACGGNLAYAQYTGYCLPNLKAPNNGGYIQNVTVAWDSSDGPGVSGYQAGTVDFADIQANHISQLLSLQATGKINVEQEPSITIFQQSYVTSWNATVRGTDGFGGTNNIPADFFSYEAARSLAQMSYPFTSIENNVWTQDGIKTLIPVGSQLPAGLGCYAPPSTTNGCSNPYTVGFPYTVNGGQVDSNSAHVGSAAWWWAQGNNASSPYYDPEFAACTSGTPCQFSIEGATGAPSQDSANQLWAAEIQSITGGKVKPNTPDISASDLLFDCGLATPGQGACPIYNFGWIADYPDPTDYQGAYGYPSSSYAGPDVLGQYLAPGVSHFNNTTTCSAASGFSGASSHLSYSLANLSWWANALNATPLPEACQSDAYSIYVASINVAAPLIGGTSESNLRVLIYDLGATIENALNWYTWTGQQFPIYTAAPWINLSSVNTNVVIGAGDAQFWYEIKYVTSVPFTVPVTFVGAGLGKGTLFSVTINGTTLSNVAPGKITFHLHANATFSWTSSAQNFYVGTPNHGLVTTKAKPVTAVAHFRNWGSTVKFIEVGLAKNTEWNVTIATTPFATVLDNTTHVLSTRLGNGTNINYTVSVPAGYQTAKVSGSFNVTAPHTVVIHVKYTPYNHYTANFSALNLTGGWCVHLILVKHTGLLAPKPATLCSLTNGSIVWTDLANGTYNFTATAKTRGYLVQTGQIIVAGGNVTKTVMFRK